MGESAKKPEGAAVIGGEFEGIKVKRAWLVESVDFGPHNVHDRLVADGLDEAIPQVKGLHPLIPGLSMTLGKWGLTLRYLERGATLKTVIIPAARIKKMELE